MKVWKTILLQAGIFTSVFALGVGSGFLFSYHKANNSVTLNEASEETSQTSEKKESNISKFLGNLTSTKAVEGDITINVLPENNSVENVKRGLTDFNFSHIDVTISDLQVSIADFDNIKVSADVNLVVDNLDMDFTVGYFDNTIYLDYLDTHFYMQTSDISDVMDMLPSFGGETSSFALPEELTNINLNSLIASLTSMKEHNEDNKHYFLFNLSENIGIELLVDDEFNLTGAEIPNVSLFGMNMSLTSSIHTLSEDITNLVNPSLKEGAPTYSEFKPAFILINDVMNIVNSKQGNVNIELDINRISDDEEEIFEDFIDVSGDIDFDINDAKLLTNLEFDYDNKTYNLQAGYQDSTIFATYKNLSLSITNQSVLTLMQYILNKVGNTTLEEALNNLGSVSSEIDLNTILTYVNDIPEYISNFQLTNSSLSLTLKPSYFDIPLSDFNLKITFDDSSVKSLTIDGLCYGAYQVNASLELESFEAFDINPESYVALDPALSLITSIENYINQDKFGVNFSITTDDNDDSTYDVNANGEFYFALRDKSDSEYENSVIKTKRTFDYGAGELNIVDGDQYPHNILLDAEPYNEDESGKVLVSYGGTSDNRTNAKINYSTFDEIIEEVMAISESQDSNISQLISSLMSSMDESNPINLVLSASSASDYIKLLDYDIINELSITDSEIHLVINKDFLGFENNDLDITVRYSEATVNGIDINGLALSGKIINITANLVDFDQNEYESYGLTEDSSYIDLSTISQFAKETLNTVELNYFHISGTVSLDFDSGILATLANLFAGTTMVADLQMTNSNNHFSAILHLTDIPSAIYVSADFPALATDKAREAYIMFDNEKDVDGDGLFYIHRHDSYNYFFSAKTYDVYAKYDTDSFMENIMTILLSDVLGLSDSIISSVTSVESEGGQIQYENIIQNYAYTENYSLTNSYFKSGATTTVEKYEFAINLGEIIQSDSFGTLTLYAYSYNNMLSGFDISLPMSAGVSMTINASLFIQDDSSSSIEGITLMHGNETMAAYLATHANDTLNGRAS